jgi:hypothetical protein
VPYKGRARETMMGRSATPPTSGGKNTRGFRPVFSVLEGPWHWFFIGWLEEKAFLCQKTRERRRTARRTRRDVHAMMRRVQWRVKWIDYMSSTYSIVDVIFVSALIRSDFGVNLDERAAPPVRTGRHKNRPPCPPLLVVVGDVFYLQAAGQF